MPEDVVGAVVPGPIRLMAIEDDSHVLAGHLYAFLDGKQLVHGALPSSLFRGGIECTTVLASWKSLIASGPRRFPPSTGA